MNTVSRKTSTDSSVFRAVSAKCLPDFANEPGCRFRSTRIKSGTVADIPYANQGKDTRSLQAYLGHRSINSTVRYTAMSPTRFQGWEKK